jgi:hypothetical protein
MLMALLYTITAAGFALNLHYCGDHVADVKVNAPAKSCVKPMAKAKMKCCKDSKLDVKVKDDHQKESTSFFSRIFAFELPRFAVTDFLLAAQQALLEKLSYRGPPPGSPAEGISVLIKNCVFRI